MSKEQRKVEWSLDFENMRVRAGQFVAEVMGGTVEAKKAALQEPLAGATSCRVKLSFSIGRASIEALDAASLNLFEAQLSYIGEYEYEVSGKADRRISLRQKADFPRDVATALSKAQDLYWNVALARHLPFQLELRGGVGEAEIDLSHVQADTVKLDTGVGKVTLTLPAQERLVSVDIRGGVGLTAVRMPAGVCGEVKIKGGVGQVRLQITEGSAVRLEAKSGLGAIKLPASLIQVEDGRAKRAWQTAAFDSAKRPISIRFIGGVGHFELTTRDSDS